MEATLSDAAAERARAPTGGVGRRADGAIASGHVRRAVEACLSGELAKHAVSEGRKAVAKYRSATGHADDDADDDASAALAPPPPLLPGGGRSGGGESDVDELRHGAGLQFSPRAVGATLGRRLRAHSADPHAGTYNNLGNRLLTQVLPRTGDASV